MKTVQSAPFLCPKKHDMDARELSKIIEEREPVLNEIRQWLMLLDKPADGEPLPN